jgi:hypothetical protein
MPTCSARVVTPSAAAVGQGQTPRKPGMQQLQNIVTVAKIIFGTRHKNE